ncbi:hypothetical protein XU18_0019 [Perkinsela sp. CCAP 1560/4]|nr:hypothetical protein XU18_0019 [Perkinsela sp. CCAP 1560/4]|eukprot:KNH09334.1 hypothetical protein XU18_0019 [Perkinsela sp. CCAP 1560/4]
MQSANEKLDRSEDTHSSSALQAPQKEEYAIKTHHFPNIHSTISLSLGICSYFFGGAMLTCGQSNRIVFLSTFLSGTYFLGNAMQPTDGSGISLQDRCFNDLAAGLLWSIASLRQFMQHRRLRWCGYSSWTAFIATSFLSLRWLWAGNL